jgi:hypothetical protein
MHPYLIIVQVAQIRRIEKTFTTTTSVYIHTYIYIYIYVLENKRGSLKYAHSLTLYQLLMYISVYLVLNNLAHGKWLFSDFFFLSE